MALVATLAGQGLVHWMWLAAFFVLLAGGELFILPVGLGLFGRLELCNIVLACPSLKPSQM